MPLKLKKLTARNWMRVQEVELDFPEKGLVWVNGDVGAGKTALGEMLSYALFEIDGRYKNIGDYSTGGAGNTYVRVEADLGGSPLVVETGYKCAELSRTGEGLRFHYNGQTIERSHVRATRAELSAVTGVGSLLAQWAVFLDGDRLKFHELSQAEAVELVMSALNQPPWAQYHERARKAASKLREITATARTNHEGTRDRQSDAEDELKEAREKVEEEGAALKEARRTIKERVRGLRERQEELRESVARRQADAKRIRREIKALEEKQAVAYKEIETERLALVSKSTALRGKLAHRQGDLLGDMQRAKGAYERARDEPTKCKECGQDVPRKYTASQIAKLKDAHRAAAQAFKEYSEKRAAIEAEERAVEDALEALEERRSDENAGSEVSRLSREFERLGPANDAALSQIARLDEQIAQSDKVDDSRLQRARAVVEERERLLERGKGKLAEAAEALVQAELAQKVAEYWVEAYGPTGIPNMVLHDTIAPLNAISGTLSRSLTAGEVGVTYSTRRELASGEQRSKLIAKVDNRHGAHLIAGNSKGEGGIIGLTVAETLAEVGHVSRRIGYRWYDEPFNTQHLELRQRVLAHIKRLVERENMLCFVVDHNPQGIQEVCDYSLHTVKGATGTTYRWD